MVMCLYSVILVEWDFFVCLFFLKKRLYSIFYYRTQNEILQNSNRNNPQHAGKDTSLDPDMSLHFFIRLAREVCAQALFSPFASSLDTFHDHRYPQSEDSEVRHCGHSPTCSQNLKKSWYACRYFSFSIVTTLVLQLLTIIYVGLWVGFEDYPQ